MTNKQKIEKLDLLLEYAIMNINPSSTRFDTITGDIWDNIDNIIKIKEYIDTLKNKGENIADD